MTDIVRPLQSFAKEGDTAGAGSECDSTWSIAQGEALTPGYEALTAMMFTSYVILVYVILLNVTISVLLEGFLSAIYDYDKEEQRRQGVIEYQKLAQPLDPLLSLFCGFQSADNLSSMIHRLFVTLDVDASGAVSFDEFKAGIESLPIYPKIHVNIEDWSHLCSHARTKSELRTLDVDDFDLCIRMELREYVHRIVAHQMNEARRYNKDTSTSYLAFKMLMNDFHEWSSRFASPLVPTNNTIDVPQGQEPCQAHATNDAGVHQELANLREAMADLQKGFINQQATLQVDLKPLKPPGPATLFCMSQ